MDCAKYLQKAEMLHNNKITCKREQQEKCNLTKLNSTGFETTSVEYNKNIDRVLISYNDRLVMISMQ